MLLTLLQVGNGELHIFLHPSVLHLENHLEVVGTGQATSDYGFLLNVAGRMETTSADNAKCLKCHQEI